ncbi:MAG: hypothetical protein SFV15_11315 [Polyangiaceae bacterium]|nr:hypothetical protein [Polyangiaceae bacterium]
MLMGSISLRGLAGMVVVAVAGTAVTLGCSSGDSGDAAMDAGFRTQLAPESTVGAQSADARAQLCSEISAYRNSRMTVRDYGCIANTAALLGAGFSAMQCQSTYEKCQRDVDSGASLLKTAVDPKRCKLDAGCTVTIQELEACVTADTAGKAPLNCSTFSQYKVPAACETVNQKCPLPATEF